MYNGPQNPILMIKAPILTNHRHAEVEVARLGVPIVEVPCELNFRRALQGFVRGLGVGVSVFGLRWALLEGLGLGFKFSG